MQQQVFCPEEKELTKTEYERLCHTAKENHNERLYLILQTICSTGIRVSELQFITVEAIHKGESSVSCKGKTRKVFIVRALQKKLLRYISERNIKFGAVFVTRTGKPMSRTNIWREMKALCVDDSRKLLVKLVGTERVLNRQQLTAYFLSILMAKVKTYIAQTMRANAINIFEIDESLETFSADIQQRLIPDFLDYGVQLKRFYVTTVVKPDGDPQYEKFKELHFRQYADIAEAKLKQQTASATNAVLS